MTQVAAAMHEVRLVGRGGAGVVTAGELLGRAIVREGRFAQAIPAFGPERRGALCTCTLRVADEPILLRCASLDPDVLLVLDPTIWRQAPPALAGVREDATLIFDSALAPDRLRAELPEGLRKARVHALDATSVALKLLGRPITNTVMMGALVGATGLVGLGAVEAVLEERFGAADGANLEALREGARLGGA